MDIELSVHYLTPIRHLPFSAYYLASSGHPILAPFYYLASFVSVITINVAEQKDVDQKITQPSKLGAKNSKYR